MAEDDDDQKTEQPTQRRLEEALKKGNVPFSRELGSFLMLGVLAITVSWFAPDILKSVRTLLLPFIANPDTLATDAASIGQLLWHVAWGALSAIVLPLVACVAVAFASSLLQNGVIISTEPIMPKLEKLSPLAGLKRMFSMRSLAEFIKSLLKITIVASVAFIAIYPELTHIRQLPNSTPEAMLLYLATLALHMVMGTVIAMFFIAIFDLVFQRFQYMKSMRMSRQELREEYKQSEGDPAVKQRLRQLRQERARKRMMAAVPEADVIITNPTHYAIALTYDSETMKAPVVVAKGQDLIALKIREVAEENKIPIVQNPPLAQALFSSTDIDDEIPLVHYEAVAKVISYVYQLKGKIPKAAARR